MRRKPLPKPDDDKNITMDRDGAEALARGLRVNGDFRLESCYKLLRMTSFKTGEHSRRVKDEDKDSDEDRDCHLGCFGSSVEWLGLPVLWIDTPS